MLVARRSSGSPLLLTPGFWLLTSALTPNEVGILLIAEHLIVYLGISAGSSPEAVTEGWRNGLLALAGSEAVRVRPLAEQAIFPNEAGMLLIAGHFYFWNTVKAGMFMKTQDLFR
jgi:hypothetical protein